MVVVVVMTKTMATQRALGSIRTRRNTETAAIITDANAALFLRRTRGGRRDSGPS